jgi:outer membrane receptor protein involved in Fe transport
MKNRYRYSLLLSVGLLLIAPLVFAQTTGEILGTVSDTQGGALPGVTVEATSPNLQGARTVVTGANGSYRMPTLPPGTYRVKAVLSGFSTAEKTAIVQLDSTATVNFTMQITQREEVVVSGEAPVVDTSNTTIGSNYTAKVMEKLPLGRNYASVVQLQPGVNTDTGDLQGRGLALSLYGSTSAENLFLIDGVNTNQVNRGVQGKIINNEFIQEVEVKTGGYQAEYGRSTGGVINVITKSGGNEFHGDVFGSYAPTSFRADQKREEGDQFNLTYDDVETLDYGADLGGFFVKDRIWFFTAYNRGDNSQDRVPRSAQSVLGQHFREDIGYNLFSGKLTFNIAQGSTLVGTYFRDPEHRDGAIFTPTGSDPDSFSGRRDIGSEDYAGRFNQLFGSFGVLTLQYAKHKDRYIFKPLDNTQVGVVDRTNAADYPFYPVFNGFGSIPGFTQHNTGDRDAYEGSFTSYFGNHELKVGGDFVENVTTAVTSYTGGQRIRVRTCSTNPDSASYCPTGGAAYTNYLGQARNVYFEHNFYSDQLGSFNPIAATTTAPPSELWSAYLQDTWRITPRLTLNAGVRYDVQEIQNADEITTIDLDDQWSPRAGLIYDWKGDGSTKLFASYGRFYYALPNDLNVRIYGSQFSTTTWNCDGPDSPNGAMPPGGTSAEHDPSCVPNRDPLFQGGASFQPVDKDLNGMYQDEFTLGVEMALTPTFAVGLKGMYRDLGNVIEDRCDLDYNDVEINREASCALINPGSGERWAGGNSVEDFPWCDHAGSDFVSPTAGQCFPDGAPQVPDAKREFKGIEFTARKTFTQNLWAQFSYLWSELRGNYDGAVRVASGQTDPGINADYDYPLFSVNADGRLYLDRPHQLRLDTVYTAPFGLSVGLGAYYRSGAPVSRYGWYNVFYPNLLHLLTRGEDTAVSDGRLPATYEANISLGYTFNFGRVSVTPTLYVFNLLDRQATTDVEEDFNSNGTFCLNAAGCTATTISEETGEPDMSQRNFDRLGTVPFGSPLPQDDWAKPTGRQDPRQIRAGVRISF